MQECYIYGIHNLMTPTAQQNENAIYEMQVQMKWLTDTVVFGPSQSMISNMQQSNTKLA